MRFLYVILLSIGFSFSSHAATLFYNAGALDRAEDIEIDGFYYNVSFADTSCLQIFNGCDQDTDFTFQTKDDAITASKAFAEQVLEEVVAGANFTIGSPGTNNWVVMTPYRVIGSDFQYISASRNPILFGNPVDVSPDFGENVAFQFSRLSFFGPSGPFSQNVFAVWEATGVAVPPPPPPVVPIPGAIWLFGSALLGLGWIRRKV